MDWGRTLNRSVFIILLTGVLGCSTWIVGETPGPARSLEAFLIRWERSVPSRMPIEGYANVANILNGPQPMLALYREDVTHRAVTEFFVALTGSEATALPILYHAERNDVPLSLAFALTWVESLYSPTAVNQNPTSIGRGLWQLNSLSFPDLREEDFFNPDVNSRHGAAYLRRCLNLAPDVPTALAIYNAGLTRVRRNEIPPTTVRYVERVTSYQRSIEARFRRYMTQRFSLD